MKNNERAEILRLKNRIERIDIGEDVRSALLDKFAEMERAANLQVRFRHHNNIVRGLLFLLTALTAIVGIIPFLHPITQQLQSGLITLIGIIGAATLAFETFYQSGMRYILYRKRLTSLKYEFNFLLDLIKDYEQFSNYDDAYKVFKLNFWRIMEETEKEIGDLNNNRVGSITKLISKDQSK